MDDKIFYKNIETVIYVSGSQCFLSKFTDLLNIPSGVMCGKFHNSTRLGINLLPEM